MFDATKLPAAPCDPATVGKPAPLEAEKPDFVRAPDGPGYVPVPRPVTSERTPR